MPTSVVSINKFVKLLFFVLVCGFFSWNRSAQAAVVDIANVEGTGFVQGGTASVTGTVSSTEGAIEGVTHQALDEESQGKDSTALLTGTMDTSFDSGDGNGLGTNSRVQAAFIQPDGKIVIGGSFSSYNGITRNGIARVNPDGSLDTSFNSATGANATVNTAASQSDGKILIGGQFSSYNSVTRNGIARINSDGSLDTSFDPGTGANAYVETISVQTDGKIIIGGWFTSYNGTTRNYIARLNTSGSLDTSFDPGTGASRVINNSLIQADGKIIISGWFTSYNGTARNYIARVNTDGSLDTSFNPGTGASGYVNTTTMQSDGKILIGGQFTSYNGTARNYIARVNTDGALDTSFDPGTGANNYVESMSLQNDEKILLGGFFTTYNGTARTRLARVNTDGTIDLSLDQGSGPNSDIEKFVIQTDGKIVIAGGFSAYNNITKKQLTRINPDGSIDTSFNLETGANNTILTSAIQTDGKILIAGDFTSYKGTTRNRVARLNANGTLDTTFDPGTGAVSTVNTLVIQSDGKILIGGGFYTYNGTARNYIARLNSDGSLDTTFDPGTGANNEVKTIIIQNDGKIFIGGFFTSYNGTSRNKVARLNADGSLDTSFDPGTGANSWVYTSTMQSDGKILIGGYFTTYNDVAKIRIARINTDGSVDTSFDPGTGANSDIYSAAVQTDGKILIGGGFTTFNGITKNRIARLNTDGSLDTSFVTGTGVNSNINLFLLLPEGKILIGGNFISYNGVTKNRVARLNTDGSLDTSFVTGTGVNSSIYTASTQSDGKILIGGSFTSYNSEPSNYLVRLHATSTVADWNMCTLSNVQEAGKEDTSFSAGTESGIGVSAGAYLSSAAIRTDGKILVAGYTFSSYNGVSRGRVALLNTDGTLNTTFSPTTGASDQVFKVIVLDNDKLLIGGGFTSYEGTTVGRIARLNANGILDTTFNQGTGVNLAIMTMAKQADGKVLIGGNFTTYNGTARARIARLNTDGTLDTSFNPGTGANSGVRAIQIQTDGKIIIGGNFTTYNGTARARIARLNTDGTLDTTFDPGTGPSSTVYDVKLQSNGKILLSGVFTSYNGTTRNRIARINAEGAIDTSFDPGTGANSDVLSLALQNDGKIIIAGNFTAYNGLTAKYIARINSDGTTDTSFSSGTGTDVGITGTILMANGNALILGYHTSYNGAAVTGIAALNADGSLDTSFNTVTGPNNIVYTSAKQTDNKILIGGQFTTYNGISRNGVARLNTTGTLDTSFDPGTGANSSVRTMALQQDNKIVIGGQFTTYNGTTRNRIARLNSTGSLDTSFDPGTGTNSNILAMAIQPDGKILIGGEFITYNDVARNRIARINTDGSLDTSFDPGTGANSAVNTFAIQTDGKIIISGNFSGYNGTNRNYLARLNSDGSLDESFDPGVGANHIVYTSAMQSDGKLLIGGHFTAYQGTSRNYVARINTDGSLDTSFAPVTGASNDVYVLALQTDGKVLIGGNFTSYNGTTRNRVARLNTNGSLDTVFAPGTGANGIVRTLSLLPGGKFISGGEFTTYNSEYSRYLVRVNDRNQADFTCSIPIPSYAQGQQSVYLRVADAMENILIEAYNWLIDTKGPNKLNIAIVDNDKIKAGSDKLFANDKKFKLEFTADDTYSDVRYIKVSEYKNFRGATWKVYAGDIDIKLYGEGKHTLYIKTKDQRGNVSDTYEQKVVLDTISPTLTINEIPAELVNPTLSGTSESGSYVKVWVNGKLFGQDSSVPEDGKWEVSKTNLLNATDISYGNNIVSIETEDQAGNKTTNNFEHYISFLPTTDTTVVKADVEEPIQVLAANTAKEIPPAESKTTTKPTDYIRYAIASIITLSIIIGATLLKQKSMRLKEF